MPNSYQVFVDDNYHYMDEDERYKLGDFETYEEALRVCKAIVDDYLRSSYKEGMTAGELNSEYVMFGDDPFIVGEPLPFPFSAREYAGKRCAEICGES